MGWDDGAESGSPAGRLVGLALAIAFAGGGWWLWTGHRRAVAPPSPSPVVRATSPAGPARRDAEARGPARRAWTLDIPSAGVMLTSTAVEPELPEGGPYATLFLQVLNRTRVPGLLDVTVRRGDDWSACPVVRVPAGATSWCRVSAGSAISGIRVGAEVENTLMLKAAVALPVTPPGQTAPIRVPVAVASGPEASPEVTHPAKGWRLWLDAAGVVWLLDTTPRGGRPPLPAAKSSRKTLCDIGAPTKYAAVRVDEAQLAWAEGVGLWTLLNRWRPALAAQPAGAVAGASPAKPENAPANLRCEDPLIVEAPGGLVPRWHLIAYREGVVAGLTWLEGLPTRALDGDDRNLSDTLRVRATYPGDDAHARTLRLVFRGRADGKAYDVEVTGPAGRATIRAIPAAPGAVPLDGAADLALADLPRVMKVLGMPEAKLARAAAGPLPAWQPGDLSELAAAVEPLDGDPRSTTGAQLARAARALAWSALMDHFCAPPLAPLRAAQALALASVASRAAGAAAPEALAARWLAPGAACGDFWVLAARAPPPGCAELGPLHGAYRDVAFPSTRPASWTLVQLVVHHARYLACGQLDDRHHAIEWSQTSTFGPAAAELLYHNDFTGLPPDAHDWCGRGAMRHAFDGVLWLHQRGLIPSPLAEFARPPIANRPTLPALLAAARRLLTHAATQDAPARRLLIEGVAERLLWFTMEWFRGALVFGDGHELDAPEVSTWKHPILSWLRSVSERGIAVPGAARSAAISPGLDLRRDSKMLAHTLGRSSPPALAVGLERCRQFPDHPSTRLALARAAAVTDRGFAIAVLEDLARRQGGDRAPLVGRICADLNVTEFAGLQALAPAAWMQEPWQAHMAAWNRDLEGRFDDARNILERAAAAHPLDPWIHADFAVHLAEHGALDEAERVAREFCTRRSDLSAGTRRLRERLAEALFLRGDMARVLNWRGDASARQDVRALWVQLHAQAALGHVDAARAILLELRSGNPIPPDNPTLRYIQLVQARGKADEIWAEVARSVITPSDVARVMEVTHIPFGATPAGAFLSTALDAELAVTAAAAWLDPGIERLERLARGIDRVPGEAGSKMRARFAPKRIQAIAFAMRTRRSRGNRTPLDPRESALLAPRKTLSVDDALELLGWVVATGASAPDVTGLRNALLPLVAATGGDATLKGLGADPVEVRRRISLATNFQGHCTVAGLACFDGYLAKRPR